MILTPKEKAQELFDRYFQLVSYPTPNWRNVVKQCALIVVDEILNILKAELGDPIEYWQEIKQEIKKL